MSRVFTIVVILLLMAVVALVPRIGTEESGLDLGDGYTYREDTLARFRLLLEDEAWSLADPPRNPQGMIVAVQKRTGLRFILIPRTRLQTLIPVPDEWYGWLAGRLAKLGGKVGELETFTVEPLLLCETECTEETWNKHSGALPRSETGKYLSELFEQDVCDLPVRASWKLCNAWTARCGLRLPSELEWEVACRAGSPLAEQIRDVDEVAVHSKNRGGLLPLAVGSLRPNSWGLYDTLGNAWEWCSDRPPKAVVKERSDCRLNAVARGGGAQRSPAECHPLSRMVLGEDQRLDSGWSKSPVVGNVGLRPAADLPALEKPDGD